MPDESQLPEGMNASLAASDSAGQDEAQNTTGGTTTGPPNQGTNGIKNVTICGVCEEAPSKYKCSRCYLAYCSVACNKVHRENHPPDPEPAPQPTPQPEPLPDLPQNPRRRYKTPFRTLEQSEELKWLFKKYPRLPEQLLEIHAATQAPPKEQSRIPASLLKDLPPQNNDWNRDKGIARGKEALRKARKAEGEDGEAIREYSELVLHLIEEARIR